MALSPQELQTYKNAAAGSGNTANSPVSTNTYKSADEWANYANNYTPEPVKNDVPQDRDIAQKAAGIFLDPIAKTAVRAGQAVGAASLKGINTVTGGALDRFTPEKNLDKALDRSLNTKTQAPGLGTEIKPLKEETPESVVGTALSTVGLGLGSPAAAGAALGLGNAMERNAGVGEASIETVISALGGKILELGVSKAAPYVTEAIAKYGTPVIEKLQAQLPEYAKPMLDKIIGAGNKIAEKSSSKSSAGAVDDTINAVNPDLSGKKLTAAYKNTINDSGGTVKKSGIFNEQKLTPDERTVELGKRLHDNGIQLGKDNVENLNVLKKGLNDTETKLTKALEGDKDVVYLGDKSGLAEKLESGKKEIPREFSAIKDNKKVYDDVINFAKETLESSDDTIKGIREGRSAFDAQAKKEYPTAFKDGSIDTKTPAGRAIKYARDLWNEHLYRTAPNGSEIQKLIGLESDIFRATESVAGKAAQGEGKTAPETFFEKHPVLKKTAVGAGVTAAAGAGFEAKNLMH